MPTEAEVSSELSVAFGILGVHPESVSSKERLRQLFVGSRPTWEEFVRFRRVFGVRYHTDALWKLGLSIRDWIAGSPKQIERYGPNRQARTTSLSRDLRLHDVNWSVSVKYKSDVVTNSSPHNLFEAIPLGLVRTRQAANWFEEQAPEEYRRRIWQGDPAD